MNRVVLDTNVVVSALLVPAGIEASVLLLALRGEVELYVSATILHEYEEVLRRPRLKLQPRHIAIALADIRKVAHVVAPAATTTISTHESDNRFLECAEAADADYIVTGNIRHFPKIHKKTRIVTGRQFLGLLSD
jgi:putative PIN family toxin of toxin-antitoxin system